MGKINWNKILMYVCFVYDPIYKTTPSYIWYIVIVTFLGSIVSLLAGISIYNTNKRKETKIISDNWIENITDENDKKIIFLLKQNNDVLTQSQLVRESGMTKVKVHRIIVKLETNNIIEKFRYGQTNKIRLKEF